MTTPAPGFVRKGAYLVRDGRARLDGKTHVNKKLCLVATDLPYLTALLAELAERPDCWWVKYSATAKDGMYLGRAFFTDAQVLGTLWARYKADPKLMCSVQDDDFTLPFRP